MKLGTIIKLSDGREATVVYNSIVGVGIAFGRHSVDPRDYEGTNGDLLPIDEPLKSRPTLIAPEALLRNPTKNLSSIDGMPFVGGDYEIINEPLKKATQSIGGVFNDAIASIRKGVE